MEECEESKNMDAGALAEHKVNDVAATAAKVATSTTSTEALISGPAVDDGDGDAAATTTGIQPMLMMVIIMILATMTATEDNRR